MYISFTYMTSKIILGGQFYVLTIVSSTDMSKKRTRTFSVKKRLVLVYSKRFLKWYMQL